MTTDLHSDDTENSTETDADENPYADAHGEPITMSDDAAIRSVIKDVGYGDLLIVETENRKMTVKVMENTEVKENTMGDRYLSCLVEPVDESAPWEYRSLRWVDRLDGVRLNAPQGGSRDRQTVVSIEVVGDE